MGQWAAWGSRCYLPRATDCQPPLVLLRTQSNFSLSQCDDAKATAYMALLGMGTGFRLLAFAFLKYTCSKKH